MLEIFKVSDKRIMWSLMFVGSMFVSEAVYQAYLYLKEVIKNKPRAISDVIFANETSLGCCLMRENPLCTNEYCNYANLRRVVDAIDQATESIDLAMYIMTLWEISSALKRAKARKVNVRIISDYEMQQQGANSKIQSLIDAGFDVRFPLIRSDDKMHHKFCIIDGDTNKRLLLNGSLNWTNQGFRCNYENIVLMSDRKIVSKFQKEFERLWIKFDGKKNAD